MKGRGKFGRRPVRPNAERKPSPPVITIAPFEFDGTDPRLEPQENVVIPDEIKLPIVDEP